MYNMNGVYAYVYIIKIANYQLQLTTVLEMKVGNLWYVGIVEETKNWYIYIFFLATDVVKIVKILPRREQVIVYPA